MSFVGKLEEFHLPDLLQIISTNGTSGKLNLTRHNDQGVIVFRRGKIIYAAGSSARETLGFLLLSENLISEDQLVEALESQNQAKEEKRLGSILIEQGAISAATIERVVRRQIEKVITEFMAWPTGYFRLERMDLPDRGEIGVDAQDLILPDGLHAETVLTDLESALEETENLEQTDSPQQAAGALPTLKSVMGEIRSPEFTGEATGRILDFARRIFRRGALFFVQQGSFNGIHQFGILSPDSAGGDRLRGIQLPLDQPSILSTAADRRAAVKGDLEPIEWNLYLISKLGGDPPSQAAAIPLVVNNDVLLVFYGDNATSGEAIGPLDELELLLNQAGLAMEKRLLEKRIEQYRTLRDT